MDCHEYKARHAEFSALPLSKEVWDTPEWEAWAEHFHQCQACSDWDLAQRVVGRGFSVNQFPCVHIANQVTHVCEKHSDLAECSDVYVIYLPRFDEYVIRTGDAPGAVIRFCPWCGARLPVSKRDRWFEQLEELGFDNPCEQEIPEAYRSAAWHRSD